MPTDHRWIVTVAGLLAVGCTTPEERRTEPAPSETVSPRETAAAPPPSTKPPAPSIDYFARGLSRADALALGKRQSPRLQIAVRSLALADAQIVTARTYPWNPVLDFDGALNKIIDNEKEWDLGVKLTQPVETGGQYFRRGDLAQAERDVTVAEIANEARLVRRECGLAYAELVFRSERLVVAKSALERAKQVLEVAERRVAAKDIPDVEVNLVRLELQQAMLEVESAGRERRGARLKLVSVLGERDRDFETLSPLLPPEATAPDAETIRRQALERRPDFHAAELKATKADRKGDLARAERWPTLGVSLTYRVGADYIGNEHQTRDKDSFLGVGVSVPLPFFDRRQGPILEAVAERETALAARDALRIEVLRDVDVALNRVELARARLAVFDKDIGPLAERSLEQTREAYRLGKVGTLEVLRAQDSVQKIRLSRLDALYDHDVSLVELAAAAVVSLPGEAP